MSLVLRNRSIARQGGGSTARYSNASSTPTVVEVMDDGSEHVMVDMGTGPSTSIPARYYKKSGATAYRKKKAYRRRRNYSRGMQVYRPMNLVAGNIGGIRGRGDYFTDAMGALGRSVKRMVPTGAFSRMGRAVGGALYGGPGAEFGSSAGNLISQLTGFGDYKVGVNTLMPLNMGHPVPAFGDLSQATVIKHREFISDITIPATPGAFENRLFVINPGNATTFPWLAQIAACYDQYQIMGLVFQFKSTAGDTATFALGSVIMATDYDVADLPYPNKAAMEQSQYCVSAKATVDQIHPLECDPAVGFAAIKYIDHGDTVQTGFERRCTDHGNFQLATVGLPAGTSGNIGELWVSYEIALYKPAIPTSVTHTIGEGGVADHYTIDDTFSTTNPLGDAANVPFKEVGSNLGTAMFFDTVSGTSWCLGLPRGFPAGNYAVTFSWVGASTALTNAVAVQAQDYISRAVSTQVVVLNLVGAAVGNTIAISANATTANTNHLSFWRVPSTITSTQIIDITAGTLPGTPQFGEIFIYRLPDLLLT